MSDIRQCDLVNRLPIATYRLQLRTEFGFQSCEELVEYLQALGISDLYLSPLFHARSDSVHGYDVVDHRRIEPTFGGDAGFDQLATKTRAAKMGILLDIVPNHMGINDPENIYWNDVLENGPDARYASFFDIDWYPPGGDLAGRVLLPFLGKPFGEVLAAGELQVKQISDGFLLNYFDRRFPLTPNSWPVILEAAAENLDSSSDGSGHDELRSIAKQLSNLESARDIDERYREQRIARRRLSDLRKALPAVVSAIDNAIERLYSDASDPQALDALEALLRKQYYRLAYWQVAVDEINYRRFFNVNDLAAIRVEEPQVFSAVHDLTFELIKSGQVTGLRIDHPDGLLDPAAYFAQLQTIYHKTQVDDQSSEDGKDLYVVIEKILSGDEEVPSSWAVSGTTGYELLNQIAGVLVDTSGVAKLQAHYAEIIKDGRTARDVAYESKEAILQDAMASELFVLASRLFRIARADRRSYDFTLPVLQRALCQYIACFTVYRTYTKPYGWEVDAVDHGYIREAIRWAKIRNPTMSWAAFDFIEKVLLLQIPNDLKDELQSLWRQFDVRLQQLTGPVTAKGLEDTAFYRYYPLVSLNEVGAELGSCGHSPPAFHAYAQRRAVDCPRALSATATHDTKRGEDLRARLHVLSEMPDRYASEFNAWDKAATSSFQPAGSGDGLVTNVRYLIHQTLLGTWPVGVQGSSSHPATSEEYIERIQAYFQKAFREAKVQSSWRKPTEGFESAVKDFTTSILTHPDSQPFQLIDRFAQEIAGPGFVNSLSQLMLKSTLPGVPDFYQGTEYWSFCLVDPDNRRPVNYDARRKSLDKLRADFELDKPKLIGELQQGWPDELKQFITWRLLQTRLSHTDLFSSGEYLPLTVSGTYADHVLAFVRKFREQWMIVVLPRLPFSLLSDKASDSGAELQSFIGDSWGDTAVELPPELTCSLTENIIDRPFAPTDHRLQLSALFSELPVAVLSGNLSTPS